MHGHVFPRQRISFSLSEVSACQWLFTQTPADMPCQKVWGESSNYYMWKVFVTMVMGACALRSRFLARHDEAGHGL